MIAVPGETVRIGAATVRVAELYLRDAYSAEVRAADGRTFTVELEQIRCVATDPVRGGDDAVRRGA